MLAQFAPAALRASIAICPIAHLGGPAVQVASWALITYPPDLSVAVWCDVDIAQMHIGSIVPLLL